MVKLLKKLDSSWRSRVRKLVPPLCAIVKTFTKFRSVFKRDWTFPIYIFHVTLSYATGHVKLKVRIKSKDVPYRNCSKTHSNSLSRLLFVPFGGHSKYWWNPGLTLKLHLNRSHLSLGNAPSGGTRDLKWRGWSNWAKSQDPKNP